jgi:hypothetical protein
MSGRSHRRWAPAAASAALAGALITSVPAAAVVVFEPSEEPPRERWHVSVPVTVEWAGVSMLVPGSWTARTKRAPADGASAASVLVAFGPGESTCLLKRYEAATVQTWQDVGVEATAELTIDGHRTERFDDMLGMGAPAASAYSIHAGDQLYAMLCSADQAPLDRWLSIAETITVP